jgi:hypothetical protein
VHVAASLPVAIFNNANVRRGGALAQIEDSKLPVVLPRPYQIDIPLVVADAPADIGIISTRIWICESVAALVVLPSSA